MVLSLSPVSLFELQRCSNEENFAVLEAVNSTRKVFLTHTGLVLSTLLPVMKTPSEPVTFRTLL